MRTGILRVLDLTLLLVLLATAFPGVGRAAGGFAEGYCTAEGKPVVTYIPADWIEGQWTVRCVDGEAHFTYTTPYNPIIADASLREQPPDFGRWVDIALNGAWLINPYNDVDAFVAKSTGRTLIPLRYISEAFGAKVVWDGAEHTVKIAWGQQNILVQIGETQAFVDGRQVVLDQAPIIWKDRTMVPLRFVVEAFGATILWNEASSEVLVTLPGVTCAPEYCQH